MLCKYKVLWDIIHYMAKAEKLMNCENNFILLCDCEYTFVEQINMSSFCMKTMVWNYF